MAYHLEKPKSAAGPPPLFDIFSPLVAISLCCPQAISTTRASAMTRKARDCRRPIGRELSSLDYAARHEDGPARVEPSSHPSFCVALFSSSIDIPSESPQHSWDGLHVPLRRYIRAQPLIGSVPVGPRARQFTEVSRGSEPRRQPPKAGPESTKA
jgi:hypothetical protein